MPKVIVKGGEFLVKTEFWDNDRAKSIPDRKWNVKDKIWVAPISAPNAKYLKSAFEPDELSVLATKTIKTAIEVKAKSIPDVRFPSWYPFPVKPMAHQMGALDFCWQKKEAALFMWMGTGKTYVAIALATAYHMATETNALLVLCPTAIKPVWRMEIEKFCPMEDVDVHVLESGNYGVFEKWNKTKTTAMKVLVVGIEALSQGNGAKMAEKFARAHETFCVVDESSRIKNYKSIRTEATISIGAECKYRIIMTGTPITQGMQDLFSQFRFLNWEILGHKSYFSFRNRYCIMGGYEGKQITGYMNVVELIGSTKPYAFVVNKEDALDLPPKVYQQRFIQPSPNQKKAIKELGDIMATEIEGVRLEVTEILERMTRYQQIVGGNLPFLADEENHIFDTMPMPGKNPKMEELVSVIEETAGKVIIWARFKPEIYEIERRLRKTYGDETVLSYHGDVSDVDREIALRRFEDPDDPSRFFVSNQQTGGMGITLNQANTTIYYSNSFSYQDRAQSEDRNHRKGQNSSVLYIDLILDHKEDKRIVQIIANKQSMAEYVNAELRKDVNVNTN